MTREDLQLLYGYNRWANARLLDAASTLKPGQFAMDLGASHGSVRGTLTHIMSGEWIWSRRWRGVSPPAMLDPGQYRDADAVKRRWREIEREQTRFVETVTAQMLESVIGYVNTQGKQWRYPLWQMMQHVVNHSSYHRGQVASMLRQLGVAPPPTDFLVFFDAKSGEAG